MHRALAIPDILFSVCRALAVDTGSGEDEGPFFVNAPTLAACARTCRAFQLPAITTLWKNNNLAIETVLLHLTPPDLWQIQVKSIEHFGLYKCDLMVRFFVRYLSPDHADDIIPGPYTRDRCERLGASTLLRAVHQQAHLRPCC